MKIEIPGYETLDIRNLVLDYNGTIALDGTIPETVKQRLLTLATKLDIYVLTADTYGTARKHCEGLPVKIMTFPGNRAITEKERIVLELDGDICCAMGNGRNDVLMCRAAALSVAVVGREGAYGKLVNEADVAVCSIEDALDLLINPKRLIATLRG